MKALVTGFMESVVRISAYRNAGLIKPAHELALVAFRLISALACYVRERRLGGL